MKLTISQFAKLHHINKRTLHYYDEIGLFSPQYRGENGYRYYDFRQGMALENIMMLKELNMSIEDIQAYLKNPNSYDFLRMSMKCLEDIDKQIEFLSLMKQRLIQKRDQLIECQGIKHNDIRVQYLNNQYIYCTPIQFSFPEFEIAWNHLNDVWNKEGYRIGCGSYISLNKLKEGRYDEYDGFFTIMNKPTTKCLREGYYLCGYHIGSFDTIKDLYDKMFEYASLNHYELDDLAYEIGMNEVVVLSIDEYITKLMIRIKNSEILL